MNTVNKTVSLDPASVETIKALEIDNFSKFINDLIVEVSGNNGKDFWKRKVVLAIDELRFLAKKAEKEVIVTVR